MTICPDTNGLLRLAVRDNVSQADAAKQAIDGASLVVITLPSLCEFVWVLRSVYRYSTRDITVALRGLLAMENATFDRPAVEAGLAFLEAGGDFADGVIAHLGRELGGVVFVSFDRKAVAILKAQGHLAKLLV